MSKIPMGSLIQKSIDRTIVILFKPFSLKKWLFLLLIAVLAGAITGGSGSGGRGRKLCPLKKAEAAQEEALTKFSQERPLLDKLKKNYRLITIAGFLILALMIVMTWAGARFRFIWFKAIVDNDASIKKPFKEYKREGDSLFRFYLWLLLIFLAFLGIIGLWVYHLGSSSGIFGSGEEISFLTAFKTFLMPALVFIFGILILAILNLCIDNFVVVIMAIERCLFAVGWQKFIKILEEKRKDFLIYLLVLIGLGIVKTIISIIIGLVCLLVLILAALLLLALPFLIFLILLKAKALFVVSAIIIGIPFTLAALLILTGMHLPFAVFFKNFSLYFLSSLKCGYTPLPLEE